MVVVLWVEEELICSALGWLYVGFWAEPLYDYPGVGPCVPDFLNRAWSVRLRLIIFLHILGSLGPILHWYQ